MKRFLKKTLKVLLILLAIIALLVAAFFIIKAIGIKGTPSGITWDATKPFDPTTAGQLVKTDGEDFQILLFSDIQIGTDYFADTKALNMMDELVNQTNPDFIMTTGDNTYLVLADVLTPTIVQKLEGYGIPWGVTLGNHDSDGVTDRNWLGNQYEGAKNSLFKMGPENVYGVGNYVVNIVDAAGEPCYSLIMMDSNVNRQYASGSDYDYIHPDQIDWYKWVVAGQENVPSMLFFHIPLPEFAEVKTMWQANELEAGTFFGEDKEAVFAPPENSGLFDQVLELDNTTNIFVGHDHINSLSAEYKGVRLTYGLKTGPACYFDADMQGATLITVKDGTNEVVVEHIYVKP